MAERISGTHVTHRPNSEADRQRCSTASLPGSNCTVPYSPRQDAGKSLAHAAFRAARSEAFHLNLPADKVLAELTARLKEKRHAETVLELRSVVRGYAKPVLTGVDLTEWR